MNRRSFLQALTALTSLAVLPAKAIDITANEVIDNTTENPYLGKEHLYYIEMKDKSWIVPIRTIVNPNAGPKYIPGPHAFMFYADYVEDLNQKLVLKDKTKTFLPRDHKPFTKHLADLKQLHKELRIHEPKNIW